MPRIPTPLPALPPRANAVPDANDEAQNVERQQLAQAQEEQTDALSAQQSFYAGELADEAELKPRLRALRLQVPQLGLLPVRTVLQHGFNPRQLQGADLKVVREAYDYVRDRHPHTALARDLKQAWMGGVESRLAQASEKLTELALMAQQLNRGVIGPEPFFAAWDQGNRILRAVGAPQLASARAGSTMAPREETFWRDTLAALDAFSLAVASAKSSFTIPDESTLRGISQRLAAAAALAALPGPDPR